MSIDVLDTIATYRPAVTSLDEQWPEEARHALLERVLASDVRPTSTDSRATRARRPVRRWVTIGATAAVAAAVLVAAQVVLPSRTPGGASPAAAAALERLAVTAGSQVDLVKPGQFRHLVVRQWQAGMSAADTGFAAANPETSSVRETWTAYAGNGWIKQSGPDNTGRRYVQVFTFPAGDDETSDPSPHYLASLPTDPGALQRYLRAHVSGSTSRDEAIFTAVGDMLRGGTAPPALRAAAIRVVERTGHVSIGSARADSVGRRALRVDFIDTANRPDEIQSLFFDPATGSILEELTTDSAGKAMFRATTVESDVTAAVPAGVLSDARPLDSAPKPDVSGQPIPSKS